MEQSNRFDFVQQQVRQVFGDQSHLLPAEFSFRAFGWPHSTSYKYTSKKGGKQFPIRLVKIGGRPMISSVDFFDFLVGKTTNSTPDTHKPRSGRKSNAAKAAGGDHV